MIREKLENKAEGMVNTAEMGYTQGYAGYKIIENVGRYFLVMQADAADFPGAGTASGRGWRTEKIFSVSGPDPARCPGYRPNSLCSGYFSVPGALTERDTSLILDSRITPGRTWQEKRRNNDASGTQ